MFECLAEWMMPALYVFLGTGRIPERAGLRHSSIVPYGAYACQDGSVNFAIQNQREWRRFCEQVIALPDVTDDERFATNADRFRNRAELESLIERVFSVLTKSEALARLERAEIASGAVNDVSAVVAHPQMAARERWVSADSPAGPIPALLPPHNLRNAPPMIGRVPALGEHTQEILAELGYTESSRSKNER
jgi:crotonobetainyl-CoA:carnitine CoA-transferase CaiB-like acyl-CoA transferase